MKIYRLLLILAFISIVAVGFFVLLMSGEMKVAVAAVGAFLGFFLFSALFVGIMDQRLNGPRSWPETWQDNLILPFLIALWEPFSRKNAHWWHWRYFSKEIPHQYFTPPQRNAGAKDRSKNRFTALWQTNFGWKEAVILEPDTNGSMQYKVGFWCPEDKRSGKNRMVCSIVIPGKQVACLVGPKPTFYFGVTDTPHESPIPLKVVDRVHKNNLPDDIMLL